MGIHGLMALLQDEAPGAIKEQVIHLIYPCGHFLLSFVASHSINQDIKAYTGRKVAIDASMAMYQFIIAVSH
jgi:flap endonuclease-1